VAEAAHPFAIPPSFFPHLLWPSSFLPSVHSQLELWFFRLLDGAWKSLGDLLFCAFRRYSYPRLGEIAGGLSGHVP
jgi:hypothetical protein